MPYQKSYQDSNELPENFLFLNLKKNSRLHEKCNKRFQEKTHSRFILYPSKCEKASAPRLPNFSILSA